MQSTSINLLKRIREHKSDSAWQRFVDLYTPLIFYWARQKGLSTDDADLFVESEYRSVIVNRALDLLKFEFMESTWQACWLAEQLNMPINAVYLAKSRVLARLRQELEGLLD